MFFQQQPLRQWQCHEAESLCLGLPILPDYHQAVSVCACPGHHSGVLIFAFLGTTVDDKVHGPWVNGLALAIMIYTAANISGGPRCRSRTPAFMHARRRLPASTSGTADAGWL